MVTGVQRCPLPIYEGPLGPRGNPRPAAPAQPRLLHQVGDRGGCHRLRLPPRFVTAALDPSFVGPRLGVAKVLGEEHRFASVRLVGVAHHDSPFADCGLQIWRAGLRGAKRANPQSAIANPPFLLIATSSPAPAPLPARPTR